jgi:predicted MFS family arabinose efflux permease
MLSMIAALVLLPKLPRSVEARPAQASMARRAREYLKMRETQFLILTSCLMGIPEILRTSFLPLYLGTVAQLDPALVGYVLAIFSVAGFVAKSTLPRLVGRFGRQITLFVFTVGCALAIMAIPLSASLWVVAVITACMGLTFGLGRPLSMAMAADASRPSELGFVVALRLSGNRVTDFLLPMAFGAAASIGGIGVVFLTGGALMLLGAIAVIQPLPDDGKERG